MKRIVSLRALATMLLVVGGATGPLVGQSDLPPGSSLEDLPRLGIGYVTNAPDILTGVSAYWTGSLLGGLGLYIDVKGNLSTPADEPGFIEELTMAEVEATPGQRLQRDQSAWLSVNAALLRPLSPELMVYLGAGYGHENLYSRFMDSAELVEGDHFGLYWVKDEEVSGGKVNFLGGAFFRLGSRLALQFGVESEPFGGTLGLSYSTSLR